MSIITLTTDLGLKDYYVASVKGAILSQCPEAVIVDISHQVSKFDILQAAFILGNSYRDFPDGTIHIIGVMTDKTKENPHVAIFCDQQYFIGNDNGIFPLMLNNRPEKIVEIEISRDKNSISFPVKDIFVNAACHLCKGENIETLGKERNQLYQRTGFNPIVNENAVRATVIYIDDFGNAFVNISEQLFNEAGKGRKFSISFRGGGYTIKKISRNYYNVPPGEMMAFFSAIGFLEIAINTGNASELLGLKVNDIVLVDFSPP